MWRTVTRSICPARRHVMRTSPPHATAKSANGLIAARMRVAPVGARFCQSADCIPDAYLWACNEVTRTSPVRRRSWQRQSETGRVHRPPSRNALVEVRFRSEPRALPSGRGPQRPSSNLAGARPATWAANSLSTSGCRAKRPKRTSSATGAWLGQHRQEPTRGPTTRRAKAAVAGSPIATWLITEHVRGHVRWRRASLT